MKSLVFKIFLFVSLCTPAASYGTYGMFGRDQCGYQQSPFPVNGNDYANAEQQRLKGLREYRGTLTAKMDTLNVDLGKAQGVLKVYFGPPWCDAMFAHMDNEFDCCHVRATAQLQRKNSRMPAGNGNNDPYLDDVVTPAPENPDYTDPEDDIPYTENPDGQHCLQTGFAAGREWNKYACRDGGQIDPQLCSNAAISKAPGNYQKCIDMIKIYRDLARQKRELSQHIADLDLQINNRGSGSDETKGGSFMSGLGNFLGGVMSVAVPFIISEYMSYTAKKQMANMPLGPRHVFEAPGNGRGLYGPGMERRGSLGAPQFSSPPPFYGPSYGYGMNYGGNYGQTLPGFQTGGFGCSPGMLGGGMNLLSMLMGGMGGGMGLGMNGGLGGVLGALMGGGGGLNMNAGVNVRLGGSLGAFGGSAPYAGMRMGLGNTYPNVPPYTMGGYTPPYQPGGIYGGTPTYVPNFNTNIQNYYSGQNNIGADYPLNGGCGVCTASVSTANSNYLNNNNANAFYYAQQQSNNQRMLENQNLLRRQSDLDYQLYQLRLMNTQNSNTTGSNYQMGNFNGLGSSLYSF